MEEIKKMSLIKKLGLLPVTLALLVFAGSGYAKNLTMNISFGVADAHPYATFMYTFADRMEKLSGGTV